VTTVGSDGRHVGLTVSAFCTVSLDPPRLLVVIDKHSHTLQALLDSKQFTVNLLADGRDELALHFASTNEDKFSSLSPDSFAEMETGMALVADSTAYLECRTVQEIDSGDHRILVGAVERGKILSEEDALVYANRRFRKLASG
jgi:flavin reductase (DIM6/NTAB) family NADH-FMN oxidoreductase RutF